MIKGELFENMQNISLYFKNNIQYNSRFRLEYEISNWINCKIDGITNLTNCDFEEMAEKLKSIDELNYYNGSGWLDYQLHFVNLMKVNGFDISCLRE